MAGKKEQADGFSGTGKIWMNGSLVDWKDAKIHIASHIVHYGSGVFEGARCYDTLGGPACFRLDAHIRRLFDSARIYRMDVAVRPADAHRRHPRSDPGQQVPRLLHPAADLSRLRLARRQPASLPGRRRDHAVGVGRLLHQGSDRGRARRQDLDVGAQRAEHDAGDGEERRQLRQRAADQDGSDCRRLRRRASRSTPAAT